MKGPLHVWLGASAFVAAAMGVHAQGAGSQDEVVISTKRLEETVPQELARYGVRVETITSQEVDEGGFNDISQALQSLAPGLYVAPKVGAFDYVELSFQGSRTSDVLWLVDGVRINNRLYNTTTPIDTIPAHMIERIEVLEGGQGLFYGTQSVAGAINIVTKEFSETPEGSLELGLDTNDGKHFNGFFRSAAGGHRFVLYASSDEADGFAPYRGSDMQPSLLDRKRGYDVQTYGLKYAFDFGDRTRFSASYQHTDAELDHTSQPKSIASATNERDQDLFSAKLDVTLTEAFQVFVKGYFHRWDAHFSQTQANPPGPPIVISEHEFWGFEDYGVNVLGKFAPGHGLEYFLGYDFQRYEGQDDVLLIARRSESVQAPFAQVRTTPDLFENVRLAAGVRHNEPDQGTSATVWNISGQWDINPNLFVRGTLGTSFRLPDAYELFAIDPCCEMGNPDLKAEESENLNLSVGGVLTSRNVRWSWELIGFARDITDLITIVTSDQGIDTFANEPDTVKVRGGEIVLRADFANGFSARGSFTRSDATRTGNPNPIDDIPESHMKLALDYSPPERPYGATVMLNAVGDVHRTLPVGRQQYGDYSVVDISARWYLDRDRRHRLAFRLENAFDEEYASRVRQTTPDGGGAPYAYWFVGTPRTFHATYRYHF